MTAMGRLDDALESFAAGIDRLRTAGPHAAAAQSGVVPSRPHLESVRRREGEETERVMFDP